MSGKRVDRNHREIVRALEQAGCSVFSLAAVGHGKPDLCVAARGHTVLVEVKSLTGTLNEAQMAFKAAWKGIVLTVRTVDEALIVAQWLRMGAVRDKAAEAVFAVTSGDPSTWGGRG